MKRIEFHEVGTPFSEAQLKSLQLRLGFDIPDEVIAFLRWNNGGRPLYYEFTVPGIDELIDFQEVLGIGSEYGIEYWLDEYEGEMFKGQYQKAMVPIGFETYGNCILVGRNGATHYWDLYEIYSEDTSKLYKISDSFSDFIDSLQRVEL